MGAVPGRVSIDTATPVCHTVVVGAFPLPGHDDGRPFFFRVSIHDESERHDSRAGSPCHGVR